MFMPPQYYLISTLAEILTGDRNSEEQRMRVRQLADSAFGGMVILPRRSKLGDGRELFVYEGDELAGGPVGTRHRAIIKPGPGGVSSMMGWRECHGLACTDTMLSGSDGSRSPEKCRCIRGRSYG